MRVKYQTRTINKTVSSANPESAEIGVFLMDIINALIDMGAPLDLDTILNDGSYTYIGFLGEDTNEDGYSAGLAVGLKPDNSNNHYLCLFGDGKSDDYNNYFECRDSWVVSKSGYLNVGVTIHAVKSGDSFFFGFLPYGSNTSSGCINFAITPMRRLSDPSASVGYALLAGFYYIDNVLYANKVLPYIPGLNYFGGERNWIDQTNTLNFPEVDTGKIPLLPVYSGVEDIYYDRVYISPMRRNSVEEKAFETDKGVFLIGGGQGTDWTNEFFCMFAFDITEAVNSAQ